MTSIYKEKVSSKLRLIHAEQMSLCNLIISRKKRDSNTGVFLWNLWNFKNSGGCFWKYVTYYYVIKYYLGHKLAIFNAVIFTLLHLSLIRWWDMRLKHDAASLWEEQADSRHVCQNEKNYCIPFYQRISIIIFKIGFSWSCSPSRATKQTYFGNFIRPQTYFDRRKPSGEC